MPNASSAAAMIRRQESTSATSAGTKTARQPPLVRRRATASPRSAFRPVTTMPAAPRAANSSAAARPSPWVLPVMTAYLPASELVSVIESSSPIGGGNLPAPKRTTPRPRHRRLHDALGTPGIPTAARSTCARRMPTPSAPHPAEPGRRRRECLRRETAPAGLPRPRLPRPWIQPKDSAPALSPGIQAITRSTGTLRTSISKASPSTGGRANVQVMPSGAAPRLTISSARNPWTSSTV